jgi:hypothetical protein
LAFLRLNPSIEIVTKMKCLPEFDYEKKEGINILSFKTCEPYEA